MYNFREKCCSIGMLVLGFIVLVIGIVIVALMPWLTVQLVNQQVPLKENSFPQKLWQDPPFKITMQFWIFNVTNPLEIIHEGARPALIQKGPYGFRETQNKKQVKYDDGKGTITYVNQKIYYFDPSLSCPTCRQDDKFTIPNVPYLAALPIISQLSSIKGLGPLLNAGGKAALLAIGEQYFVSNITAAQFLFDGYDDRIFQLLGIVQPGRAPNKMGLFYGKNNTDDGVYVIKSGVKGTSDMGKIVTWNGHSDLSFEGWWNSTVANLILGSDGTVFPPFVKRTDTVHAFISDLCRSISMKYAADVDFQGINAYRFELTEENFDPYQPENEGFCWPMDKPIYNDKIQPMKDGGYCLPKGMVDLSKCQFGSPIVASIPQFGFAPEEVKKSVTGLKPEAEKYLSYVLLEPTSGVLLSGARIIQLNVAVQPDPKGILTRNMKSVVIPLAWVNETVSVDQGTRDYVYQNVVEIRESAYVVGYVAMGFGALWIVCIAVAWSVSRITEQRQRRNFLRLN